MRPGPAVMLGDECDFAIPIARSAPPVAARVAPIPSRIVRSEKHEWGVGTVWFAALRTELCKSCAETEVAMRIDIKQATARDIIVTSRLRMTVESCRAVYHAVWGAPSRVLLTCTRLGIRRFPMKMTAVAIAITAAMLPAVQAQTFKPKPAFAGQTEAPPPAKPSAAFSVQTITARLSGPWSLAFLPDGNFLVTESNGAMRTVRPDGVVSAPISGLPPIKVVAAQGLHDVLLDPDFARNRLLYFTYFSPPRGEAPAIWPNEFFYEKVWTRSFAERRTMDIGMERAAPARLSEDNRSLQ